MLVTHWRSRALADRVVTSGMELVSTLFPKSLKNMSMGRAGAVWTANRAGMN